MPSAGARRSALEDPDAGPRAVAVEVVYAAPGRQLRIPLSVAEGMTVGEAIAMSGILSLCPDIDLGRNRFGIYGVPCRLGRRLRASQPIRIEIYRPLLRDPKELRRDRAAQRLGPAPPGRGHGTP